MAQIDDPKTWAKWCDVDPEFAEMMNQKVPRRFPPVDINNLPTIRSEWKGKSGADMQQLLKDADGNVTCEEISIPLHNGNSIQSLLFKPKKKLEKESPLVVLIHGGGFLFGCAEMEAPICISTAQAYGCVCISLNYSLSPEAKFPVAYEECWDALSWIAANATVLGANPAHGFVLGGTSSGGQMTAALSHWARDRQLSPPLTGIYLNVPCLVQPESVTDKYKELYRSREQNEGQVGLSKKTINVFEDAVEPDPTSELWSPLNWTLGHQNLPRTYFQICGSDVLRDDALIYERVLRQEYGIETKVDMYPGLPHVFWYMYPSHSAARKLYGDGTKGIGWLLKR